jgi:hypothetical protein
LVSQGLDFKQREKCFLTSVVNDLLITSGEG